MLLRHLLSLLLLAITCPTSTTARSSTGDKVLVILEPKISKSDYSKFWQSLEERGFELTFKGPKDETAQLVKYDVPLYDHLIMFAPSTKAFAPSLSPQSILSSQLENLNTLYLLSPDLTELQRDTFREYDLEFVPRDQHLIDAFSHLSKSQSNVLLPLATSTRLHKSPILSDSTVSGGPIVFPSGTVHVLGQNPYLIDVLHASKTSYVGEIDDTDESGNGNGKGDEDEVEEIVSGTGGRKKNEGIVSGEKAGLVSAMQTRENVRIGFVGSGEMLSDKYWDVDVETQDGHSVHTGNAGFVTDFTKWIFQESGVLKIVETNHHRQGETEPRELYRIKDDLTYTLTLAQHVSINNSTTSTWTPISLPDLQLEFTMLDPHVRIPLIERTSSAAHSSSSSSALEDGTTIYESSFIAPDRHGVFKFVVDYWRPGWSYIHTTSTASVVPFRHDEYPRFIKGAWPFYTGAISMSLAFLLFVVLWVRLGEDVDVSKGKKKAE